MAAQTRIVRFVNRTTIALVWGVICLFVAVALVRYLNFDESLALHAGWLSFQGIPASPYFFMPFTAIVGWLAACIDDPGLLFVVLRLGVSLSVIAVLVWAAQRLDLSLPVILFTGLLLFTNGAFVTHGPEFRYDWAILIGWIFGFISVQDRSRFTPIALGICIAWLAAHHLKGVYFAGWLYLFALARLRIESANRRRHFLYLNAALVSSLMAWCLLALATGHGEELWGLYRDFFTLSAGTERVWPWDALAKRFKDDSIWWLIVLATALPVFLQPMDYIAKWACAFTCVAVSFWFVHPHPWAYMLVPALPFVSLLAALGLQRVLCNSGLPDWQTSAATILITAYALSEPFFGTFGTAWHTPRTMQVETLRALKAAVKPGDKIIDPSGLAYFVPPAMSEWYLDTLFVQRLEKAEWTQDPQRLVSTTTWALETYRLRWLPESVLEQIDHSLIPVGGGLLLTRNDSRVETLHLRKKLTHTELGSYW